jgi:hypothetical protein
VVDFPFVVDCSTVRGSDTFLDDLGLDILLDPLLSILRWGLIRVRRYP